MIYHFRFGSIFVFLTDPQGRESRIPRSKWEAHRTEMEAAGHRFYPAPGETRASSSTGEGVAG